MSALVYMLPCVLMLVFSSGTPPSREILPIDAEGIQRLIKQSSNKVVVVNMWATWCAPCIEEFPVFMRVRNEYRDDGVDVVFVSIDEPKRVGSLVMPFLKRMNVDFTTYIKRAGDDERFINALSREWSGALPATFVYDRDGVLATMRVEQLMYEDLVGILHPLLQAGVRADSLR